MTYTDTTTVLREFLSIQSISSDPARKNEMLAAVKFLEYYLVRLGFTVKQHKRPNHPPVIIARKEISPNATTIGIYGHYDVQPEDPVKEWKSPPFTLTRRRGKLYARGIADNKGAIIQCLTAIERLTKQNQLNSNIVCIFEGEEETGGSENLDHILSGLKKQLADIDIFLVPDAGFRNKHQPQIYFGVRGLVYFELTVKTGEKDLHSGIYGNRAINPLNVLSNLFAEMRDADGKVRIPRFYDNMRRPTKHEMELLSETGRDDREERKEAKTFGLTRLHPTMPWLSTKVYPSCDLHGIVGGFIGDGPKTVIPNEARAKFSFRLIEGQNPAEIEKLVRKFVKNKLPKGVKHKLDVYESCPGFSTDTSHPLIRRVAEIFEGVFKNKTVFNRTGGSIPAIEILSRIYKKPVVLTGFVLPDSDIHAPNENFDEHMFFKGITALERLFSTL